MLQIILFSYFTENLVMSYQHFFWWQKNSLIPPLLFKNTLEVNTWKYLQSQYL